MTRKSEPKRILDGVGEGIFSVLPQTVLANLRSARSENALLWNLFYPVSRHGAELHAFLDLPVLWGTQSLPEVVPDLLQPYFWGYGIDGNRLIGLDDVLEVVDGPGPRTEVDLFLLGQQNLVAVEAKRGASPGRCQRFQAARCPEIHPLDAAEPGCRYWHEPAAQFNALLNLGTPPEIDQAEPPPCYRHYQLARTLLVGQRLADQLKMQFHFWLVLPVGRWRTNQMGWLDFTGRVRDSDLWRRLRVIAFQEVQNLPVQ